MLEGTDGHFKLCKLQVFYLCIFTTISGFLETRSDALPGPPVSVLRVAQGLGQSSVFVTEGCLSGRQSHLSACLNEGTGRAKWKGCIT